MTRWLRSLEPWGTALLRVVLGVAMAYHGWQKVLPAHGWHFDLLQGVRHYAAYVVTLGLPPALGYVSAAVEALGGLLLVLGAITRFVAFLVAGNMLVALVAVNLHHGYGGSEYTLALIAMAVMLVCVGGGAASVDSRLGLQ